MRLSDLDFSELADSERLLLAHELLQSVVAPPPRLSQAEIDEIDRRVAEVKSGAVRCEPWPQARAELLRCLE